MGIQGYLEDYNSLRAYPMDLGVVMSTYGITTPKALLSKFTIKEKILPVMSSRADAYLTIPTLYHTINAAIIVAGDAITGNPYIPDVGKEELLALFQTALTHFSIGTAPEVMRELLNHIELARNTVKTISTPKLSEFRTKCEEALCAVQDYLSGEQEVAIGHMLATRNDGSPIILGNAVMSSLTNEIDIGKEEDLRGIVFVDPFSGLATNDITLGLVEKIGQTAGRAINSIQTTSDNQNPIIAGAAVASNDICEQVLDYLIEVRCASNNVKTLVEFCEKTNCDMECDLFKDTTSEGCVADVPSSKLGWADPSIVSGSANDIKMNTNDIFSMNQITGKNIQYVLGAIISSDNDSKRKALTEKLKTSIVETLKWESTHENFQDLPVAHFVDTSVQMLETLTKNTKYHDRVQEAYEAIKEEIQTAVESGECMVPGVFNPTPTLNAITPFPVGVRTAQLAFDRVWRAETDEEMDEAMLEFAKVYNVEENVFNRTAVEEGGASITIRNLGSAMKNLMVDAMNTGNFEQLHARNLKMVDSCKTQSDINYLKKDVGSGINQLNKLKEKVVAVETGKTDGMANATISGIEKKIKKGMSSKKIDAHIKWLNDVYRPALTKKAKEIRSDVSEGEIYDEEDDLLESNAVAKGARNVSRKIQKGSEKAIRNVGGTAHEIKQAAHNAVDPMEKYIGQMMEKLKKEDANRRREIIIKGGVAPKVLRWIKRSIPLIAGAAIGVHVVPVAAVASGIALIGFIASDKMLDAKEKRKILREIEDELEIVNEKIDDARGDSNKQKRYELIRIRNNLKRTQDRIKYNLKE